MKVEVSKVLSDIAFFKEHAVGIRFLIDDKNWLTKFPSIARWASGAVVIETANNPAASKEIANRLAGYNINAKVVDLGERQNAGVKFQAIAGDEILAILQKAFAERELDQKLMVTSGHLKDLEANVDMLIKQQPYVQASLFSRGVNAMKQSIAVLQNVRRIHEKENKQYER